MRHSLASIMGFAILPVLAGSAALSQTAPPAPQSQQPPQPNPLPGSPQHQKQVDDAQNSESGRAGKQEPLPKATTDGPVLLNGMLNVPGAPTDSQTAPAKFSERNAALDKLPTMATALQLNDEQRKKIAAVLRSGNAPAATVDTTIAEQLPSQIEMVDLPDTLKTEIPDVNKLKYVHAGDRILLVDPPNRIVVAEIKN